MTPELHTAQRSGRRYLRRTATLAVVTAVTAVAAVALLDTIRSGGSLEESGRVARPGAAGPRLEGPGMPAPGALPGRLVFAAGSSCKLQTLDLSSLELRVSGPSTRCGLWVSPSASDSVVTIGTRRDPASTIGLVRLDGEASDVEDLGESTGVGVAWSPAEDAVAWCTPAGTTIVRSVVANRTRRLPGCDPRFGPSRTVLTRPVDVFDLRLFLDGETYLDTPDLAQGLAADVRRPIALLGYDARDDLLAVVLVGTGKSEIVQQLELWRSGRLNDTLELARASRSAVAELGDFGFGGKYVRLSPGGSEVAVGQPSGQGPLLLFDLRTRQRVLLPDQSGVDWSPDGRWLALATEDQVLVYGSDRDAYSYALPLVAGELAWRP